jgi:hypothetical protein
MGRNLVAKRVKPARRLEVSQQLAYPDGRQRGCGTVPGPANAAVYILPTARDGTSRAGKSYRTT